MELRRREEGSRSTSPEQFSHGISVQHALDLFSLRLTTTNKENFRKDYINELIILYEIHAYDVHKVLRG
jgi:hypothetical protein